MQVTNLLSSYSLSRRLKRAWVEMPQGQYSRIELISYFLPFRHKRDACARPETIDLKILFKTQKYVLRKKNSLQIFRENINFLDTVYNFESKSLTLNSLVSF